MRNASKVIFTGLEGSGKSLRMARYVYYALRRNNRFLKKTGIPRPIYSNMHFSDSFHTLADKYGIPIIYWKDIDELVGLSGCDVFIDEIGTYFDSRLWTELSLDVRRWIAQCDKNGVNIYGTAQDFAQVDKAFRRLVKQLYYVSKIAGSPRPHISYPPVRLAWGLFMLRSLDPRGYKEDEPKLDKTGFPSFFLLHKEDYSIYNTNQAIEKSAPAPLKHIERSCPDCGIKKVFHS